tara:strand:+ start:667 stop:1356 length:690 start_codon:yes stop_codon:yes gene_type:complete
MKAYILRHDDPISHEYAKICAETCDVINLDWEYFDGWSNCTGRMAWCETGIQMKFYEPMLEVDNPTPAQKANVCSAGHGAIWKKIADGEDEVGIVLEHDALMYYKPDIKIPDNTLVTLGYKVTDPENYAFMDARDNEQHELTFIDGHEGAHAYMMTKRTAQNLVWEIEEKGILGAVDNAYFIRGQRRTSIPLAIMSPTPAVGYLRKSTIWSESAHVNYKFIESFAKYYK